jgi:abortive infection bacteriophage resistance protein
MPKLSQAKHGGLLARIADSTHKASNDPKIRHLATEYGITDYPPIWTMMEIVPLGIVTFYFHGLPDGVQKAIADTFHVRPNVFGQWLMALKNTRNICAHHSRLWNFHIVAPFTKRIGRDPHLAPFVECLERQPSFNYTTTFTVLSLCAYCMGIIRPESKWKERCRALLKTATPFILRGMGAPNDWETLAMWQ